MIGLVTSEPFLASAARVLDLDLIPTDLFKTVANWCLTYYSRYGKPPGRNIEGVYHAWVEKEDRDEAQTEAIHDLLESLSGEYDTAKGLNVSYLLDELGQYLSLRKIEKLKNTLDMSLLDGDKETAATAVNDFSLVNIGDGAGINPLSDREAWLRAFAEPAEPLFKFGGAMGDFVNWALTRDALIGIQAPEKTGKTWWCVEFLIRALLGKRKVALFEVGDLSEGQIMLRLGIRMAGLPLWKSQCGNIEVPLRLEHREADEKDSGACRVSVVKSKIHSCRHPVTRRRCVQGCRRFMMAAGIPRRATNVMLSVHANSTINVQGIDGLLKRWAHEQSFVPDVVIIDYPDILAPEDSRKEPRHQVNDTWKAMRRLSQQWHCLVIAPTQASATAYGKTTQGLKQFSEDKRKYAHVTGMLGLNQTSQEKDLGVMRLNWIVLREAPFNTSKCVWVGQCLPLGRALCCSLI